MMKSYSDFGGFIFVTIRERLPSMCVRTLAYTNLQLNITLCNNNNKITPRYKQKIKKNLPNLIEFKYTYT